MLEISLLWPLSVLSYLLTGGRDQGHDPDPHHGVPLRGGHAGHQAGLRAELREVSVHSHLGESLEPRGGGRVTRGCLSGVVTAVCPTGRHLRGLQEAAAEAVWRERLKEEVRPQREGRVLAESAL